jgi:hypothetical protein
MDTNKTCPNCGKALHSNAPAGLCPECLMQAGFPTGTEPDAAQRKFNFRPPTIEELKPSFPQLEILNFIGQGGMGAVYKARQPMLDRYVALKILPPEAATGPGFTERFTREARALARLNHPNIVAVHEFGQSSPPSPPEEGERRLNRYHYLIMEFVDGANLREMERVQRLSSAQALSIVPKICEALQYAHDEGVVHRDIKPENILVDKKGRVKIADFGIAKILGADQPHAPVTGVVGTPHYMAPEQIEKPQTVDHRADIFSVGVVFYEMLTGELPIGRFAAPSKKVQIDVRLDEVVLRALEKEPEQRYQQVGALRTEVETIAASPRSPNVSATPLTDAAVKAPGVGLQMVVGAFVFCALTFFFANLGLRSVEISAVLTIIFITLFMNPGWRAVLHRRNIKIGLWVIAALLLLNVALPHRLDFSQFKTNIKSVGVTQPWLSWVSKELPDGTFERNVVFNRRSSALASGVVGLCLSIALLLTRRTNLNNEQKAPWRFASWRRRALMSVVIAVVIAAAIRVVVQPFKVMNDAVAPEITRGSTVFVYKLSHSFRPGDIIIRRWFATGYPDKYLLGRVAAPAHDGQIAIERRDQSPQQIALSDIVGKVIFNTRREVGATTQVEN